MCAWSACECECIYTYVCSANVCAMSLGQAQHNKEQVTTWKEEANIWDDKA